MASRRCLLFLSEAGNSQRFCVAESSRNAVVATKQDTVRAGHRALHTTRPTLLPRQLPRRTAHDHEASAPSYKWERDVREAPKEERAATQKQKAKGEQGLRLDFAQRRQTTGKDTPWYLRKDDTAQQSPESLLGIGEEEVVAPSEAPGGDLEITNVTLPQALQGLHSLLREGSSSAIVARADDVGEDGTPIDAATGRPPIHFINARAHDQEAWTEWVVVVQVRSSAGGAVSRVARDVGTYLRHVRPPPAAAQGEGDGIATSLDDFLGAPEDAQDHGSGRSGRSDDELAAEREQEWDAQAAEGDSSKRFWRPRKILSREAQDGMRTLHQHDPEHWSRQRLADTFQMSVESVRRILKSKWQPPSSVVIRQNRRANERDEERRKAFLEANNSNDSVKDADPSTMSWADREAREIALITQSIREANADKGDEIELEQEEPRIAGQSREVDDRALLEQAAAHGKRSKHLQPVFYEGLVATPSAGASGSGRGGTASSSSTSATRARNGIMRGDGEWCLVDAGWVVVHVMSARARNTYDVESQYASSQQDLGLPF